MRMINRTGKERIGNGFQEALSLLAARTKRPLAGVMPSQLKEGRAPCPAGSCGFVGIDAGVLYQPAAGASGWGWVKRGTSLPGRVMKVP